MSDVLIVEGLSKSYGGRVAVDDVGFRIAAGKVVGYLGPNGAGKSSTLKMITGLVRPDRGRALILGRPYAELTAPARTLGVMLDSAGAHPARTGADHLRVHAIAASLPESRIRLVLDQVGLTDAAGQRFGAYSTGMRQRLSLAQALLGDPEILLLDEPANGLDPQGIVWLRSLIRAMSREGRTVLVSSHAITEIEQVADDVIILNGGRVQWQGSCEQFVATVPRQDAVRLRVAHTEALVSAVTAVGGRVTDTPPDGSLTITGLPLEQVSAMAVTAGGGVLELRAVHANLEEAFLRLTERRQP